MVEQIATWHNELRYHLVWQAIRESASWVVLLCPHSTPMKPVRSQQLSETATCLYWSVFINSVLWHWRHENEVVYLAESKLCKTTFIYARCENQTPFLAFLFLGSLSKCCLFSFETGLCNPVVEFQYMENYGKPVGHRNIRALKSPCLPACCFSQCPTIRLWEVHGQEFKADLLPLLFPCNWSMDVYDDLWDLEAAHSHQDW